MLPSHLASAHALVKALKGAKDPPERDGLSKIEIAQLAVRSSDLYLPNKDQIISEWILDVWIRSKPSTTNIHPILHPAYHDILHALQATPVVDIGPLLLTYISTAGTPRPHRLAVRSFRRLRGSARPRVEAWFEVWTTLITSLAETDLNSSDELIDLICDEWIPDDSVETLKKLSDLLETTLPSLAVASQKGHFQSSRVLHRLFPWPSLQNTGAFGTALQKMSPVGQAGIALGPDLLRVFIATVTTHRFRIFSQPSSSNVAPDVYMADKVRNSIRVALAQLLEYLDQPSTETWRARLSIWGEIQAWGGYLETDSAWSTLVSGEKRKAEEALTAKELSRPSVLELLAILERLDHDAASLGPEVIGWCLAAPPSLHRQAELVVIAMIDYHRLTQTFTQLVRMLLQAQELLLTACDSSKATRSVYRLLADGILNGKKIREALCGTGLARRELDSIAQELTVMHATPAKRRRIDKLTALDAAISGVRSLLYNAILSGTNTTREVEPFTLRDANWASSVMLTSRLRMWSATGRTVGHAPLEKEFAVATFASSDTPSETRSYLALYLLSQSYHALTESDMDQIVQTLLHSPDSASLWRMLAMTRAIPLLSSRTTPGNKIAILRHLCTSNQSFTAEWIETPGVIDALDVHLAPADASLSPSTQSLISFASPAVQAAAMRAATSSSGNIVQHLPWMLRLLRLGNAHVLASIDSLDMIRQAVRLNAPDLVESLLAVTVVRQGDSMIAQLIDVLSTEFHLSRDYWPAALLFQSVVDHCHKKSLSPPTLENLERMCLSIQDAVTSATHSSTSSTRLQILRAWLSILRLGQWLGTPLHFDICDKLVSDVDVSWRDDEIIHAVHIIRLQPSDRQSRTLLKVLSMVAESKRVVLSKVIDGISGTELEIVLPVILCGCLAEDPTWMRLLLAVLTSARDEHTGVIRRHSAEIMSIARQALPVADRPGTVDILRALRLFFAHNPFTLTPHDLTVLLEAMQAVLRSRVMDEAIFADIMHLATAVVRYRSDSLVSHVAGIIDMCSTAFQLFVAKSRDTCRAIGVAEAALFSRLIATLVNVKHAPVESFRKSLVKHLPSILVAYARAVADPRGRIRPDVRREIVTGLWPVCDAVTAGGRIMSRGREGEALGDAFGLGDGPGGEAERDVWADLWMSWSSKRYTGQG